MTVEPIEVSNDQGLAVGTPSGTTKHPSDIRNVLICVGTLLLAMLLTWPFADLGFGDDVAYSHLALTVYRTGQMKFNGWEAAIMVPQVYWGIFFIKVFGFSLQCMRLSTVPLALGTIALCYALVRRMGWDSAKALMVTLLLALNPIFLPLAVSYMTDVPGLFFLFGSLNAARALAPIGLTLKEDRYTGVGSQCLACTKQHAIFSTFYVNFD